MNNAHGNFPILHREFCKTIRINIELVFLKKKVLQTVIRTSCKKFCKLHRKCTNFLSKVHLKFSETFILHSCRSTCKISYAF